MKNKQVKRRFDDMACNVWCYSKWADNDLVNGWMDYIEGNLVEGSQRDGRPYVSLTANQLKSN